MHKTSFLRSSHMWHVMVSIIKLCLFLFQCSDHRAHELWTQLLPKLPSFFTGITVRPAPLHGDLWSGNAAKINTGPGGCVCAVA